ncbi:hypothetical protein K501DRAFT_327810 [Backusella circina FSU 941]|nr:hypothetical protein K501DRAFT_327810 [Backusella circina FSU 941]
MRSLLAIGILLDLFTAHDNKNNKMARSLLIFIAICHGNKASNSIYPSATLLDPMLKYKLWENKEILLGKQGDIIGKSITRGQSISNNGVPISRYSNNELFNLFNVDNMSLIRTKTVIKASRVDIENYYTRLTIDFQCLHNKIISFTTHLMKLISRDPVPGISFKLQEEERERRDKFVPEVSTSDTSVVEIDPETNEPPKVLNFGNHPGVSITNHIAVQADLCRGRHDSRNSFTRIVRFPVIFNYEKNLKSIREKEKYTLQVVFGMNCFSKTIASDKPATTNQVCMLDHGTLIVQTTSGLIVDVVWTMYQI